MDILLVIAGMVALVWGAVVMLRGGLLGGCLAVLLAGSCFGYPLFHLPAGPIPLTADRVLWAALIVCYAIWRRKGWADPKPLGKPEYILFGLIAVLLASTFTHDWRAESAQPLARLVFYYLMPLGMYWVARQSALSERAVRGLFACLAVFGVYLAVTAIAEVHQAWWLVYPKYIADPGLAEFLGRGRGPLLNPAGCGFFQSVCLFAALMWWPRLNRPGRIVLVLVSLLLCLGIYSTLTRSAWMGAAAGLFLMLAVVLPRSWRVAALGGCLLVGTLVVATQWEHVMVLKRDTNLSAQAAADSVRLRPILARVAWNMFLDRPVLGCGFGQYPNQHVNYLADRETELPLERARPYVQHNVFLALLTETGLVGAGLVVVLLALWTVGGWRLWRRREAPLWARQQALLFVALLGSYLCNAMFHDVGIIPMVNMLLFFMAGVTSGLVVRFVPVVGRSDSAIRGTNPLQAISPRTGFLKMPRF